MSDLLSKLAGTPIDLKQSIMSHIDALLNTRKGSLMHMPDYGMPEYDSRPESLNSNVHFINALKNTIECYEPRVISLIVDEVDADRPDCVLQVKLTASLAYFESVSLAALLLSGGEMVLVDNNK